MVEKEKAELEPTPSAESADKQLEEVQPETVTPDAAALVAESEKRQAELQAEIDRKEAVIQRLKERGSQKRRENITPPSPPAGNASTTYLEGLRTTAKGLRELGNESEANNLEQAANKEEQRITEERFRVWQEGVIADHRGELESSLEEVNIDWDSDDAKGVRDAFEYGAKNNDWSRAYFKLNQAINKGAKQPEPVDDKKKEKEIKRQTMEEAGLLETDVSSPAGASGSDDEFIKRFNTGELNSPEDIKRAQEILSKL